MHGLAKRHDSQEMRFLESLSNELKLTEIKEDLNTIQLKAEAPIIVETPTTTRTDLGATRPTQKVSSLSFRPQLNRS